MKQPDSLLAHDGYAAFGYLLSRGLLSDSRGLILRLATKLNMSHTLKILQDQVKFYKQELMNMENAKQYHLKQMKDAGAQQNKIQEVIDDLYKTIDKLQKDSDS